MPASVEILIVAYNCASVLRDCLASIAAHHPEPGAVALAIHVYDNASSDGTADMVSAEFPAVHLHRGERNLGFAAANNLLARRSGADHLLLLNPDTVWERDILTPLLAELRTHPGAVLAAPQLVYPGGLRQPSSQRLPRLGYELAEALHGSRLSRLPGLGPAAIRGVCDPHGPSPTRTEPGEFIWATCWLLDGSWVRAHGLFDERFDLYDEDLDFCRRLRDRGEAALYVPSVTLVHIGGASSAEARKRALMRRARARYYRVHHGPAAAWAYAAVTRVADARARRWARRRPAVGQAT